MILKNSENTAVNQTTLTINVEKAEFEAAIEKSYRKNAGKFRIQGFRPGKAPRKIIERVYGSGVFYEDAVNLAFPDAYKAAIEESGITPVDQAEVELVDISADGFTFTAKVTTKPVATVGEYKGLSAEYELLPVTEEDVARELKVRQNRQIQHETVERPAAAGDTVVLDFEGFVDGTAFDGGKGEKHELKLGSGQFIPGFEDQLVGVSAGEAKDVVVTFPEDYGAKELAGKEATFKCLVREVKEEIVPELDDEFAKDVSEFDTLDELKNDIKGKLEKAKENNANAEFENRLIDALIDITEVEIPDCMIEQQIDRLVEDFDYRFRAQGATIDSYLKMTGSSMEEFRANFTDRARRQVMTTLALEAVVKAENIEVTPEEIEAEYAKVASNSGVDLEQVRNYMPEEAVREDIAKEKAINIIKENAVKTEPVKEEPADASPAAGEEKTEE
ncbi:MAG: trigger factor [Clostridiales bacterium]|nr:trigger factor [Clostridiales bacterium]